MDSVVGGEDPDTLVFQHVLEDPAWQTRCVGGHSRRPVLSPSLLATGLPAGKLAQLPTPAEAMGVTVLPAPSPLPLDQPAAGILCTPPLPRVWFFPGDSMAAM